MNSARNLLWSSLVLLLVGVARPAAAQSPYANLWAQVSGNNQSTQFTFPVDFTADVAIAIHDTNGDGVINSFLPNDGSVEDGSSFPFARNSSNSIVRGRRIGSASVLMDTTGTFRPFCGENGVLIYAQQFDASTQTMYFLWFALPDPQVLQARPECQDWEIDFGLGSFTGDPDPR